MFSQLFPDAVRHAQYAGSWYESEAVRLAAQLSEYLGRAGDELRSGTFEAMPADEQQLLAIVAPHAGYAFSGTTAAYSYQAASSLGIKRVFLLGPSHHVALHGVALPQASTYETPLGNLSVDQEVVTELATYPFFSVQSEIHKVEHSLEMQLPFVRQALGDVKIVPLVVGALHGETEIRLVAEVLKGFVTSADLVIVSSDFTHYGTRYSYVPFVGNIRQNVEKLDKEAFQHLAQADLAGFMQFHDRTQDTICGLFPCAVLCAMLPPDARGTLLKYSTSQDSTLEDKDNSVSYLAIAFAGSSWPANPGVRQHISEVIKLSFAEKQTLLAIARRALHTWVTKGEVLDLLQHPDISITPTMKQCFGAFVTLYTKAKDSGAGRQLPEGKQLRGCIGSIWPVRPLHATIVENAIASCSRDPRFSPVTPAELNDIELEISILTPPRRVGSYKDIIVGEDGVILSKFDKQAVFLPHVATEFGWDLAETLRQLSLKAGLKENDWQEGAKYDLFQSLIIDGSGEDNFSAR